MRTITKTAADRDFPGTVRVGEYVAYFQADPQAVGISANMTLHEQQRQADKAHHEGRIAWLTADAPRWACGTPVAKHIAAEMLLKSRQALRYVDEHGMSTNSADARCTRVLADGDTCGLVAPCPDCGRACHDVGPGA